MRYEHNVLIDMMTFVMVISSREALMAHMRSGCSDGDPQPFQNRLPLAFTPAHYSLKKSTFIYCTEFIYVQLAFGCSLFKFKSLFTAA